MGTKITVNSIQTVEFMNLVVRIYWIKVKKILWEKKSVKKSSRAKKKNRECSRYEKERTEVREKERIIIQIIGRTMQRMNDAWEMYKEKEKKSGLQCILDTYRSKQSFTRFYKTQANDIHGTNRCFTHTQRDSYIRVCVCYICDASLTHGTFVTQIIHIQFECELLRNVKNAENVFPVVCNGQTWAKHVVSKSSWKALLFIEEFLVVVKPKI